MIQNTEDLRITATTEVDSPETLHKRYPMTDRAAHTVTQARRSIQHILGGTDDRLLVIIGPCSIHDPVAAHEYADKLCVMRNRLAADLEIVMRVYFEKPRTTVGWKGLINDPHLDGSFDINTGLGSARQLLLEINDKQLPAGTEFLDLISPQYVADLISWGAIGARTTESQGHRELASGLSCPVGFKNGTDGNTKIAIDAIGAASRPHVFMSVTKQGRSAIFNTAGNPDAHVILRGGKRPNYDRESVEGAMTALQQAHLQPNLMIDFSHANSHKQHARQKIVAIDVAQQIADGNRHLIGVMIESHLMAGNQSLQPDQPLTYGQSITDACLSWEDSVPVLEQLADAVRRRRRT